MKYYLNQKIIALKEDFNVKNDRGEYAYKINARWFSIGRSYWIIDLRDNSKVALIKEKVVTFLPRIEVRIKGKVEASIDKRISFFRDKYHIKPIDWDVTGNLLDLKFTITSDRFRIAEIRKKFITMQDAYEIEIFEEEKMTPLILAIAVAIDMISDDEEKAKKKKKKQERVQQ